MIPGLITGITVYVISSLVASGMIPVSSFLVIMPLAILIMIMELYRKQDRPFDSLAHTFFPVLYTALPFSLFPFSAFSHSGLSSLIPIEGLTFSPGIIIGFFLLIWANDTGAYLAGVSFGKAPSDGTNLSEEELGRIFRRIYFSSASSLAALWMARCGRNTRLDDYFSNNFNSRNIWRPYRVNAETERRC